MSLKEELQNLVTKMRSECPLVHNITNYVTVNDCANAVLAIGGSPIMADDKDEVEDITSISKALVLNIGTLNKRTVESMILAGKKANELKIPVILDPVGAGASSLRNKTTEKILKEVKVNIIRGNLSEMSFICGFNVSTKGVDSALEDSKNNAVLVAETVARKYKCIAAITGVTDVVSDGKRTVKLHNGTKMLSKVTGTGCMTSAIVGTYAGACNDYFIAAIDGISSMAIAGELAYKQASSLGTGSFHIAVINGLSKIDDKLIGEVIKIEDCTNNCR